MYLNPARSQIIPSVPDLCKYSGGHSGNMFKSMSFSLVSLSICLIYPFIDF